MCTSVRKIWYFCVKLEKVHIKLLHIIININISFIYKINLKNKTLYIQDVPF